MKKLLHVSICGLVMLLFTTHCYSQITGDPQMQGSVQKLSAVKPSSNLSPALNNLHDNFTLKAQKKGKTGTGSDVLQNLMQIRGDKVLVDFTAKGDPEAARAELQKMGVTITAVYGRVLSGLVPISLLPKLEGLATIRFAKPAYKPRHQL
ncbi:MAG: hypothetical protein ABIS01_15630, partial [Ferruginibacter sp.]